MRITRGLLAVGMAVLMVAVTAFVLTPAARAETTMVQVNGLERIKAVVSAGASHAALRADGAILVWDDGAGPAAAAPRRLEVACSVRAVAMSADRVAAVCPNGTVWVAGIASPTGALPAVQVSGLDAVKAVAMARTALVAVQADGTVWVARFDSAASGPPAAEQEPGLSGVVAVAAGVDDFVAIRSDSTAWARMAIKTKGTGAQRLAALPPVRSVSVCGPDDDCDGASDYVFVTGDGQTVALALTNDTVVRPVPGKPLECTGCVAAGNSRVLSVSGAGDVRVADLSDGSVSEIKKPGPALKAVATGSSYDMALAANGTVWMWPVPNRPTQVPGLPEIKEIAAGGEWTVALAADGRVFAWSAGDTKRTYVIPHVLDVSRVAATPEFFALQAADGQVAVGKWPAAGAPPAPPVVNPPAGALDRKWGDGHVTLMKFDGTLEEAAVTVDAGGITFGTPVPVSGIDRVIQIAAAENGYLLVRDDGTVWGARWGRPPVQLPGEVGGVSAKASMVSFTFMKATGTALGIAIDEPGVHVWGDPHVDEVIAVAAGGKLTSPALVMLRANGTVVTFSQRVGAGQVTEILDGIAVTAGSRDFTVLKADGTVWRWRAR